MSKKQYIDSKRKWYLKNRERILKKAKEYCKNNKEKISYNKKEYYENNKETLSNYKKKWYIENKKRILELRKKYCKENRHKVNSLYAKRKAYKLQATPKWLTDFDLDYIKMIYLQAQELSEITGIKHEVDHIIPLKGKNVSGLHCPTNLQVLTSLENKSKYNKLGI